MYLLSLLIKYWKQILLSPDFETVVQLESIIWYFFQKYWKNC